MDGSSFREAVASERATELDRLGSNKLLVALTGADLTTPAVLSVAAASEAAARDTFAAWADDEEDDAARERFAAMAERERAHYDRVIESLRDADPDAAEAFDPGDDPGPVHGYLRSREGTIARLAAGTVGRGLVSLRTHAQVIGFFVNEPDARRADLFRDLRAETEAALEAGLERLETTCEDEDDWNRARASAEYVVTLAYDGYADALREMGVDPKTVC
ncbi:MAG: rubrerythrin family protein [Haloferacaceae archaeon]|jgi:hypothetical protein